MNSSFPTIIAEESNPVGHISSVMLRHDSLSRCSTPVKRGICLKELLSQGVENPFGLQSVIEEESNQRQDEHNDVVIIPQNKKTTQYQSDEFQNFGSSPFTFDEEEFDGDNLESREIRSSSPILSIKEEEEEESKVKMEDIDVDLNVNMSRIVDEVLKEQDQSFRFRENEEDDNYHLESSEIKKNKPNHIKTVSNVPSEPLNPNDKILTEDNGIVLSLEPSSEWQDVPTLNRGTPCADHQIDITNTPCESYNENDECLSLPSFIELVLSLNESKDKLAQTCPSSNVKSSLSCGTVNQGISLLQEQEENDNFPSVNATLLNLDECNSNKFRERKGYLVNGSQNLEETLDANNGTFSKMPLKKRKLAIPFENIPIIKNRVLEPSLQGPISSASANAYKPHSSVQPINLETSVKVIKIESRNPGNVRGPTLIYLSASQICSARYFLPATIHPLRDYEVQVVPAKSRKSLLINNISPSGQVEDLYFDCSECSQACLGPCQEHYKYLILDRSIIRNGTIKDRAKFTLPWPLNLRPSMDSCAGGLGVWTDAHLPKNLVFGPYEGRIIAPGSIQKISSYSWMIARDGCEPIYIDADDVSVSNWLRYVNCGSTSTDNNLEAFHFFGQIYYRSIKRIERGSELLVWFGGKSDRRGIIPQDENNRRGGYKISEICNLCGMKKEIGKDSSHLCPSSISTTPTPIRGKRRRGRPSKLELSMRTGLSVCNQSTESNWKTKSLNENSDLEDKENIDPGMENFSGRVNNNNFMGESPAASKRKYTRRILRGGKRNNGTRVQSSNGNNVLNSINRVIKAAMESKKDNLVSKVASTNNECLKMKTATTEPGLVKNQEYIDKKTIAKKLKPVIFSDSFLTKSFTGPISVLETSNSEKIITKSKRFSCLSCFSNFDTILEFLKHDLKYFYKKPLQCGLCHNRFESFYDLREHISFQQQSIEGSNCNSQVSGNHLDLTLLFKCKGCKSLLRLTKNLTVIFKNHIIDCHQSIYADILMDYNTFIQGKDDVKDKETFQIENNVSSCPFCFQRSIDVNSLSQHLMDHNSGSVHKCKECHVWLPSEHLLLEHSKCHDHYAKLLTTMENANILQNLPVSLLSRIQLLLSEEGKAKASCLRKEKNEERNTDKSHDVQSSTSHIHTCTICCKTFTTTIGLKQHMNMHNGNVSCKVCNKTFNNPTRLRQHKKIHNKTPSFDCSTCKKKFRTKLAYFSHISTHKRTSLTYNCDYCGNTFEKFSTFNTHIQSECPMKQKLPSNAKDQLKKAPSEQEALSDILLSVIPKIV